MIKYMVIYEKPKTVCSSYISGLPWFVATGQQKNMWKKMFMKQRDSTWKDYGKKTSPYSTGIRKAKCGALLNRKFTIQVLYTRFFPSLLFISGMILYTL